MYKEATEAIAQARGMWNTLWRNLRRLYNEQFTEADEEWPAWLSPEERKALRKLVYYHEAEVVVEGRGLMDRPHVLVRVDTYTSAGGPSNPSFGETNARAVVFFLNAMLSQEAQIYTHCRPHENDLYIRLSCPQLKNERVAVDLYTAYRPLIAAVHTDGPIKLPERDPKDYESTE